MEEKKHVKINIPGFVDIDVDGDDDEKNADGCECCDCECEVEDAVHVVKPKHRESLWYKFPYPVLALLVYFVLGYFLDLWHPGWIVFLTIPMYYAFADAIVKKKRPTVSVGFLITVAYLVMGIGWGMWHPWWLLFLTIPIFDFIFSAIRRRDD